jgi:type I restriction enzyme, S subunit
MNDELPQGWAETTLQRAGAWRSGGTPSRRRPDFFGKGIRWVKSGDLPDGPILNTEEGITKLGLQNSSAKLMPTGTISMALYGATIGKLGVMTFPAATNQACANVIPDNRLVESNYLFYYLLSERRNFILQGQGGAQPNISQEIVRTHPLLLAPLEEQRRIMTKLEKLLRQVDACQQRLTKIPTLLKRFRQSVLAAACSGQLTADWRAQHASENASPLLVNLTTQRKELWEGREAARMKGSGKSLEEGKWKRRYRPPFSPSDDLSADFPFSWSSTTVSQVALLDVGFAFKSSEFFDEGIRLLRGENLEPGKLRWSDTRCWSKEKLHGFEYLLIEEGEIILALDRPVISTGLKIARATKSDLPCLLVQRMMRFKMVEPRMTSWLFYNLNLPAFIDHLSKGLTGSDLPHVTGTGVAEYTFGLPPLAEQQEIVCRVEYLFALADRLEARFKEGRKCVDRITQAVLAKAFRGELVPTEFDLSKAEGRSFESAQELLERISRNGEAARKKTTSSRTNL